MCGRYLLTNSVALREEMERLTGLAFAAFAPAARYNVAPSQTAPTLAPGPTGAPELHAMRWGFVPSWETADKPRMAPINARAETALEKPMFRQAVQKRRCLIPADGFYEWKREGVSKQPFDIHLTGRRPFFFAGIFESGTDRRPATFLVFTTTPNALMSGIHDRMPAILTGDRARAWLKPGAIDPGTFTTLTAPFPAPEMEARPVSSFVNNARNEGPDCLAPPHLGELPGL